MRQISKSWGPRALWADVSFEVDAGEVVLLTGPSGSGKSTLLRALVGLEEIDAGAITWRGARVWGKKRLPRVVYVGQEHGLFSHIGVLEQITLPLKCVLGYGNKLARDEACRWLAEVELLEHQNSGISELSGGQKQRLAIARAAALQPRLLCLDEPTSAQDDRRVSKLVGVIEALAAGGCAIVVSTHDSRVLAMPSRCMHLVDNALVPQVTEVALV